MTASDFEPWWLNRTVPWNQPDLFDRQCRRYNTSWNSEAECQSGDIRYDLSGVTDCQHSVYDTSRFHSTIVTEVEHALAVCFLLCVTLTWSCLYDIVSSDMRGRMEANSGQYAVQGWNVGRSRRLRAFGRFVWHPINFSFHPTFVLSLSFDYEMEAKSIPTKLTTTRKKTNKNKESSFWFEFSNTHFIILIWKKSWKGKQKRSSHRRDLDRVNSFYLIMQIRAEVHISGNYSHTGRINDSKCFRSGLLDIRSPKIRLRSCQHRLLSGPLRLGYAAFTIQTLIIINPTGNCVCHAHHGF